MRKYFVFCLIIYISLVSFCSASEPNVKEGTETEVEQQPEEIEGVEKEDTPTNDLDTSFSNNDNEGSVSPLLENKKEPAAEDPPIENDIETDSSDNAESEVQEEAIAETLSIRINEVLPNPDGTDSGNEFIELYNFGDNDISLKDWKLSDKTNKPYVFSDITIASGSYITLFNKKDFSFGLNNSDETIIFEDNNGEMVVEFSYERSSSGRSWNYAEDEWYEEVPTPNEKNNENPLTKEYPLILINEIFPNPEDDEQSNEFIELYNPSGEDIPLTNWTLTDASQSGKYVITNTTIHAKGYHVIYRSEFSFALNNSGEETVSLIAPNGKTSSSLAYTLSREGRSLNRAEKRWYWEKPTPNAKNRENPLTKTYPKLILSEILPNPSGDESSDEFIEIFNPNESPIDLENWVLHDASISGSYTFMNSLVIQPHTYFVIYRSDFSFALNNSHESLSLIAPNEKTISSVTYEKTREDVSLNYEQSTGAWRHSKHLTPGSENIFNNLPEITHFDIDDEIYKDVYADFDAHAYDRDNENLKVRWDFGDGHRSYKWKTRHKYDQKGTYHGELRIQDESEEITKKFTVKVKKYPKYEIKIIKIVPNPAGKDRENEYVVIKNGSDERIDLKTWSIATGAKTKTLVNHPIRDHLRIKSDKNKTITRDHAAISLPNKKGVIEIRRPDGSVSDRLKYGENETSIPDNASYEIVDDVWQWIIPVDLKKQDDINTIIAHALHNEKMFSQKRIESEIAYNLVHRDHEKTKIKNRYNNDDPFRTFFMKINALINKILATIHERIRSERIVRTHEFPIYPIHETIRPCDKLYIPSKKNLTFCR